MSSNIGYAATGKNQVIKCKYGTTLVTEDGDEYPIIRKDRTELYLGKTIDVPSVEILE